MTRPRRVVATTLVIAGIVIAANALVSGPHAFADGKTAVAIMVVAGIALVGAGLWEFRPKHKKEAEPPTFDKPKGKLPE